MGQIILLASGAMDHFPKRVAAEVDILYDSHKVWRKYDSTTFGRGVSIGHSCKGPEVDFWDWSMEADSANAVVDISHSAAFIAAQKDERRAKVDDLVNAEGNEDASGGALSSVLAQLARMEAQCKQDNAQFRCHTPDASTAVSEDSRSHSGRYDETSESEVGEDGLVAFSRVCEYLARGPWDGSRDDSYTLYPGKTEGVWTCWRKDKCATSKSFTISYDWDYDLIWWGTKGTYFASVAQIVECPWEIKWCCSKDVNMCKPKFTWRAQADSKKMNPASSGKNSRQGGEYAKPKVAQKSAARRKA